MVEQVHQLRLVPGGMGADAIDGRQEIFQLRRVVVRRILDDANVLEALHVQRFGPGVELFEILLTSGVAGKEVNRPLPRNSPPRLIAVVDASGAAKSEA